MRALVLQEFGRIAVEERQDPIASVGEVLIAVIATGICGSDIHGFTGENGRRVPGQVMGHESVGRVAAFGPDTAQAHLAIHALVTFNPVVVPEEDAKTYAGREQHSPLRSVIGVNPDVSAAFADYLVVPIRNVVSLPDSMPVAHGALIEPLAVALHAVRRVDARKGQRVLVIGGGPIGQSVVLALGMQGVTDIVLSEVDGTRRQLCERIGASTIDPGAGSPADQLRRMYGRLVDVTIDAVGITRTVDDALNATRQGGSVCLVGMGSPEVHLDAYRVSTEERALVGSFAYSAQDFNDAAGWIATAPVGLDELISREISPAEANDAFAGLARGDGTAGKVLVRFDI